MIVVIFKGEDKSYQGRLMFKSDGRSPYKFYSDWKREVRTVYLPYTEMKVLLKR